MIGSTVEPGTYTIRHFRGDDHEYDFYVTTPTGAVQDITGWSFFFTVKFDIDDDISIAKFQKALTSGISIVDGPSGHGLLAIAATDVAALQGPFVYDLRGVDTAGKKHTLRSGLFIVPKQVTTDGTAPSPTVPLASFTGLLLTTFYFQDMVTLQYYKQVFESGVWNTYGPSATIPF